MKNATRENRARLPKGGRAFCVSGGDCMATAQHVLEVAKSQIGYREYPADSNKTKYGAWYGLNGYAWCVIFVMWCFEKAGCLNLLPKKTASCSDLMNAAKKAGIWVTKNYLPGDVLIYNFPGNKVLTDHCGILESISGNTLKAIEGNTALGNDANGGGVLRRTRKVSLVYGAVRPKYDVTKSIDEIAQEVLDGKWGNGDARRERLTIAGYDYAAVQKCVSNLILGKKTVDTIAREVIDGKWGNGAIRTARLAIAGYNAADVQARVNAILSGKG